MSDSQSAEADQYQQECDCGNEEFYFCEDLNLDKAWKAGNKWCRICTDCGNRYFLSKTMYRAATDQYVILEGEDDPVPVFDCPRCEKRVTGQPSECPYCDVEYHWGDDDADEEEGTGEADQTDEQGDEQADSEADN